MSFNNSKLKKVMHTEATTMEIEPTCNIEILNRKKPLESENDQSISIEE